MCLLYVMDVNDIKGGYAADLVSKINEKELDYFIVINKVDTLPSEIVPTQLKKKIVSILNENDTKFHNLVS